MVDRSKEFYQQQLAAHAAWANISASGYPGASHGSPFASAGSSNPYQDYVQRLQHLSGQLGHNNPRMFGGNFLGNGSKDVSGLASPFGFHPGHTMHFPSLGSYGPMAAHSSPSLPTHIKTSCTPPSTPVPAHVRSSHYSQTSYPSPYSSPYCMTGYGASQSPTIPGPVTYNSHHPNPTPDQNRCQTETSMRNGSITNSSLFSSSATSAYTHLLQAAGNHEEAPNKNSSSSLKTAKNNIPHISQATNSTASSSLPPHSQTNVRSKNEQSYDGQAGGALRDRFGGHFSDHLTEMAKTAKDDPAASVNPACPTPNKIKTKLEESTKKTSPHKKYQEFTETSNSTSEIGGTKSDVMHHGNDVENQPNHRKLMNTNSTVQISPRIEPPHSNPASMSITNKIKDLERKLAFTSTSRQTSSSTLSNDDRSELKGLWKMQANIFKQKLQSTLPSKIPPRTSPASVASSEPINLTSTTSASITVPSHLAPPRVTAKASSASAQISERLANSPPLLHMPRSPQHPPPPLPSYSHPPDPQSTSSHTSPHLRTTGPPPPSSYKPLVPSSEQVKSNTSIHESLQLGVQNDRMEVKNSGIPGPSAISWKRKSDEDFPISRNMSKKRKPCENDSRGNRDPYSFEDDNDKSRVALSHVKTNDDVIDSSELDSDLTFLMSRDNDVESDEISLGRSSSPVKMKKRPKIEEWSVKKDKKTSRKAEWKRTKDDLEAARGNHRSLWGVSSKTKPPMEPASEKTTGTAAEETGEKSSNKSSITNAKVWLQAFGASVSNSDQSEVSTEADEKISQMGKQQAVTAPSILEIPPEVRRKPRPKFGGLIHFDSDWNHGVRRHHERCRVPSSIENSASLKPKILAGHQTPKKSYEDQARRDMVSPPNMILLEKARLEKAAFTVAHKLPPTNGNDDELSGELPSIVETILKNRKKLREATDSRIYKVPFMKEKKKRMTRTPVNTEIKNSPIGLLPTPGIPLFNNETKDVWTGFGNFRHYTLENFIQKDKPTDLLASNTLKSTHYQKSVLTLREIFGHEIKKIKKEFTEEEKISEEKYKDNSTIDNRRRDQEDNSKGKTKCKQEKQKIANVEGHSRISTKKIKKSADSPKTFKKNEINNFSPKFRASNFDNCRGESNEDELGFSHEVGDPSESEKSLQFDLGVFALDLLENNPSWSKQVTIQNLVIWEPTEPLIPEQSKKKKSKKKRVRRSGMDFQSSKKKPRNGAASRADSVADGNVHQIVYSLENVIGESNRWVIDKNAGETILHRASKMGYPDVVAYALDLADMAAGERDYAGLTPLHKAALKGNFNVVRILLSYGADPGAGIKGTRALHEGNTTGQLKHYFKGFFCLMQKAVRN